MKSAPISSLFIATNSNEHAWVLRVEFGACIMKVFRFNVVNGNSCQITFHFYY